MTVAHIVPSPPAFALSAFALCTAVLISPTALFAQALPPPASEQPKPDPSFPFSTEIEDFARAEAEAGRAGIRYTDTDVFLGSSSIRLWDVHSSFPDLTTINRGFGGATTPDVLHYYDRLRPRRAPRSFVVYVGENDLSAGTSPEKVAQNVLTLLGRLRTDYPRTPIVWLSLKPSPIRWTAYPRMLEVNRLVAARARDKSFDYLEVGSALLAPDGLPDASLFRPDGLHMNPRGYAHWNRLVSGWLANAVRPVHPIAAPARLAPRPPNQPKDQTALAR